MASNQVPSVGRIVHYVAYGTPGGEYKAGAHRAAIITEVYGPSDNPSNAVGLAVLNPTGLFFQSSITHDPTGQKPGTWHWPEYVAPRADGQWVEDAKA